MERIKKNTNEKQPENLQLKNKINNIKNLNIKIKWSE